MKTIDFLKPHQVARLPKNYNDVDNYTIDDLKIITIKDGGTFIVAPNGNRVLVHKYQFGSGYKLSLVVDDAIGVVSSEEGLKKYALNYLKKPCNYTSPIHLLLYYNID